MPSLFFLTDPQRTPDPMRTMAQLPAGAAVIYRAFGAKDAEAQGRALRQLARARRLVFLVGADAGLAARLGADGVHLPERLMHLAPRLRQAHPKWLITAAAHGPRAIAAAGRLRLNAALVSAVFTSESPSAGAPLGALRFARLNRTARLPIIALGGINARTAPRLVDAGAAGLAAVGGLTDRP
jgi:thiamine-phosphate pyrophosphorylase